MSAGRSPYVSIEQAATWVRRSTRTIERWIKLGLLPAVRGADGKRRVRLADVTKVEYRQRTRTDARDQRRRAKLHELTSVSQDMPRVDDESPDAD